MDLQNDFCHPQGGFAGLGVDLASTEAAVTQALSVINSARAAGVPIVFVRSSHSEWTDSPMLAEMRERWQAPRWCMEGTWGAEFYRVQPQSGDHIVRKHRYSAFLGTDLEMVLRAKGLKTIVLVGVATEICVETTARDGFMRDFYVVVVGDGCATSSRQVHKSALQRIGACFGTVTNSTELAAEWASQALP